MTLTNRLQGLSGDPDDRDNVIQFAAFLLPWIEAGTLKDRLNGTKRDSTSTGDQTIAAYLYL